MRALLFVGFALRKGVASWALGSCPLCMAHSHCAIWQAVWGLRCPGGWGFLKWHTCISWSPLSAPPSHGPAWLLRMSVCCKGRVLRNQRRGLQILKPGGPFLLSSASSSSAGHLARRVGVCVGCAHGARGLSARPAHLAHAPGAFSVDPRVQCAHRGLTMTQPTTVVHAVSRHRNRNAHAPQDHCCSHRFFCPGRTVP